MSPTTHEQTRRESPPLRAIARMFIVLCMSIGMVFVATPAQAAVTYLGGIDCGTGTVRMSSKAAGLGADAYVRHAWKYGGIWRARTWYSNQLAWRYSAADDSGGQNLRAISDSYVGTNSGGVIDSASRYCLY